MELISKELKLEFLTELKKMLSFKKKYNSLYYNGFCNNLEDILLDKYDFANPIVYTLYDMETSDFIKEHLSELYDESILLGADFGRGYWWNCTDCDIRIKVIENTISKLKK